MSFVAETLFPSIVKMASNSKALLARYVRSFLIGKDSHGCWVVQDESCLRGGLFIDRAQALKFAMFENGHRPQGVIMVPDVLELNMSANPNAGRRSRTNEQTPLRRVA